MNQNSIKGGIAAIALCIGVVVATLVTAASEMGSFPLDSKRVEITPSASPSK